MKIAAYISGHGFGHLAQLAPVLNSIHALDGRCRFLLRTPLPHAELKARLAFDFEHIDAPVDIGVIQKNAIEEDRAASIAAMRSWVDEMPEQVKLESEWLSAFGAGLVISDISPLAFPAAAALGIESVGLATLDWHTIYEHWLDADDPLLTSLAGAYSQCKLLLTPPMAMDMPVFANRQCIPLIAACADIDAPMPVAEGYEKQALVLFGGAGQPSFDLAALAEMPEWLFWLPGAPENSPANVRRIDFSRTLRPVDVIAHVDVVLCKPGYGVLAECWRGQTPIAWVERPDFPEFPMLRGWLQETFPAAGMSRQAFHCGDWLSALEGALSSVRSYPDIAEEGAEVAARIMLGRSGKQTLS